MTRNSNFGNRVRLNQITSPTSTAPNAVSIKKDTELIQEFEQQQSQQQRQKQPDFKTIQISIETYKSLQKMTTYFNMPSYDDIIQTMVKHFKGCVDQKFGEYHDTSSASATD